MEKNPMERLFNLVRASNAIPKLKEMGDARRISSPQDQLFADKAKKTVEGSDAYKNILAMVNEPVGQISDIAAILSGIGDKATEDRIVGRVGSGLIGMTGAIKAYHGTPHTFTPEPGLPFGRFKKEAIGSGEGAAAYGHGTSYSAETPAVAQGYQKTLSPREMMLDGKRSFEWDVKPATKELILKHDGDLRAAQQEALDMMGYHNPKGGESPHRIWYDTFRDSHEELQDIRSRNGLYTTQGHLLELSHEWPDAAREAADPLSKEHLLDWDKPLSEQSEKVKTAIVDSNIFGNVEQWADYNGRLINSNGEFKSVIGGREFPKDPTGSELYSDLIKRLGDKESASDYLSQIDIPGIKYLDGSSRGAGEGTHNFVMFEPEYTKITARDGISLQDILDKYKDVK